MQSVKDWKNTKKYKNTNCIFGRNGKIQKKYKNTKCIVFVFYLYFFRIFCIFTKKYEKNTKKYECNCSKIQNTKKIRINNFKNTKNKKIRTQNFKNTKYKEKKVLRLKVGLWNLISLGGSICMQIVWQGAIIFEYYLNVFEFNYFIFS